MNKIRVVEIGGTHIRRADVVDGRVLDITKKRTAEVFRPKADHPRAGVSDVLASLDKFCRENWNNDIEVLVILVAGPVRDNIIEKMPNFPDFPHDINLAEKLNFDVPIFVFNDMTAAVTGMAKLLKDQNIDTPFWGLTWSTGLGGKFWDGQKISIDTEIGHEIKIDNIEAEKLLGGRNMVHAAGPNEVRLMAEVLKKLNEIAPTNLFVFKGAIALNLFKSPDILKEIPYKIVLSPEPEKDSLLGAAILAKKVL